jgi:aspartokinase
MLKITDAVEKTIRQDEVALQALEMGILNLSAYAEQIVPKIEQTTLKPVKKGTVVVALMRLSRELQGETSIRPAVILDDMTIKSPLCDITFAKTAETREQLAALYHSLSLSENAFFAVTQSMTEVTIIAPQSLMNTILKHFSHKPKAIFTDQVGITVKFSDAYLGTPNVLYTLQSALAVYHVNFTEIISTYTEFSFIVDKKYLEVATQALRQFFT